MRCFLWMILPVAAGCGKTSMGSSDQPDGGATGGVCAACAGAGGTGTGTGTGGAGTGGAGTGGEASGGSENGDDYEVCFTQLADVCQHGEDGSCIMASNAGGYCSYRCSADVPCVGAGMFCREDVGKCYLGCEEEGRPCSTIEGWTCDEVRGHLECHPPWPVDP